MPLTIGETKIPNTEISICITPVKEPNNIDKSTGNILVLVGEWESLQRSLVWRNRREGDLILRGKMHRQVRRLYAQKGIAVELRHALPLLTCDEEIVWAPFVGMSDDLAEKMKKETSSPTYKIEINVPNNAF